MFICKCGGLLIPVAIEQFPSGISNDEKINYERVCDVECQECGKVYYSQPYDNNKQNLRLVKETKRLNFNSQE